MHPSTGSLFPPVLPPNFLHPPLQPPLASLFPLPNADCEVPSSGWSAHSGGSRTTSSLGSSSSDGDMGAKIDGRTVRSSRCSPDVNRQPMSLSSAAVVDADADMPLSLVTRRETTSRGSSVAESGVCTGDSVARAASTETSRTPSLDGENGCHLAGNGTGSIHEQTVPTDHTLPWSTAKGAAEAMLCADDEKVLTSDDVRSSSAIASRSSGIVLPPRKRLTRNAEELGSSTTGQSEVSSEAAGSPSSAPNFRSCWKKFAAKSNISGPSPHRTYGSKPQYDCRTYFQKLAEQARAAAASKAFVPGKIRGHCYRNANKTSPRSSDQNTGSPRVTRSQSKPKKSQSPKSSPAEPPAPVRKSTRKKSINTRFDEYDRTIGKNKKSKSLSLDSGSAALEIGKEMLQAAGDDDKNLQRKNRRRCKQMKGESSTDAELLSGVCADTEDSTSQSQFSCDTLQPAFESDGTLTSVTNSSVPAASGEGSDLNARTQDAVEPEPSTIITVLPPKFRHFKIKTAATVLESSQLQTDADWSVTTSTESGTVDVHSSIRADVTDSTTLVTQSEVVSSAKLSLPTLTENGICTELPACSVAEEPKATPSHSVSGRKSLLYRSSAAAEGQQRQEANVATIGSEADQPESFAIKAVGEVSTDHISTTEKCDNKDATSEDTMNSMLCKVSVEDNERLLVGAEPKPAVVESSERGQDGSRREMDTTQPEEAVTSKSSGIISCKSAASLDSLDRLQKTTSASAVVFSATSDRPCTVVSEDCNAQVTEVDSSTVSVNNVTDSVGGGHKVLSDSLSICNSHGLLELSEGSNDVIVKGQSVELESSDVGDVIAAVTTQPQSDQEAISTVTSDLSCRTKLVDVSNGPMEKSVSNSSESLKRLLPDEAVISDDAKKRRIDSVDPCAIRPPTDSAEFPDTNFSVNSLSSSSEHKTQSCSFTSKKPVAEKLSASLPQSVQNSLKPDKSKRSRSKSTKTSCKLKPNRTRRTATDAAETPVSENNTDSTAETLCAESKLHTNAEKRDPLQRQNLRDGSDSKPAVKQSTSRTNKCEIPASDTTPPVKYAVANAIDKMCDRSTDAAGMSNSSEQKTLRISLVALSESGASTYCAKDSIVESAGNSNKMPSSSAVVIDGTTAASVVSSLKKCPDTALADAEPVPSSAGCVISQESVALEHDSSSLLSQCKSLSVVLEKMQQNSGSRSGTPPSDSAAKPSGRRRRGGPSLHRASAAARPEVSDEDSISSLVEKPAVEPQTSVPFDDEYRFPDDGVSDSHPPQRALRRERKTLSLKVRNSFPVPDRVDMSPAATSDSSSRGAVIAVDSSSVTPNAGVANKSETGSSRSRRRRQNLPDDEDTRSLSPFAPRGSPVPVVEASLDGHKLKLRITKCVNRSTLESSTADAKAPPPSSVEAADNKVKLIDAEIPAVDHRPPSAAEMPPKPVSRRRQLKVEGIRSRFLTLHKPLGMVPSTDHVKCRLVKVGRRQWMSVGGEEPDDDESPNLDAETLTKESPTPPSINEMAQHPTRDRLLLVTTEKKEQRRRGRPPKPKTDSVDTGSSAVSDKRSKKRVRADVSHHEISSAKPEPLREVVSRPVRVDPVPWLDSETDASDIFPYCALGDSSSRTIATDIDDCRLCVSTPADFTSNIDLLISNALSDCGIEFAHGAVRMPRSMFFVPSELERLMGAMVLDDLWQPPRRSTPLTPLTPVTPETNKLPSTGISRSFSYSKTVSSPVFSLWNDRELDVLLSQSSMRPRNSVLPLDANDSADNDCTVVGYECPPAPCYPDPVELPPLLDPQFVDEDYLLPSDPQLYSCVDLV